MGNNIIYREIQYFRQWWIWLLLLFLAGLVLYQVFDVITQIDDPFSLSSIYINLIIPVFLILFIILLFAFSNLETIIKADGIYVKFFPFHLSYRYYPWDMIYKSYIRKYKPIGEFGGWGIRGFGKKRALNVQGSIGLQLVLTNGKQLIIGTSKPSDLSNFLKDIERYKE